MWRFFADRRGQYLVAAVMLLMALLLGLALAVDMGMIYARYRRLQAAVVLAAQAASHQVDYGAFFRSNRVQPGPEALALARRFLLANARGLEGVAVEELAVRDGCLILQARARIPTLFWGAFGVREVTVRARGRACPAWGVERERG